jgi:hypothetical protein
MMIQQDFLVISIFVPCGAHKEWIEGLMAGWIRGMVLQLQY